MNNSVSLSWLMLIQNFSSLPPLDLQQENKIKITVRAEDKSGNLIWSGVSWLRGHRWVDHVYHVYVHQDHLGSCHLMSSMGDIKYTITMKIFRNVFKLPAGFKCSRCTEGGHDGSGGQRGDGERFSSLNSIREVVVRLQETDWLHEWQVSLSNRQWKLLRCFHYSMTQSKLKKTTSMDNLCFSM